MGLNGKQLSFDFSAYEARELVGSHSDDIEDSQSRKQLGRKGVDPTWGPVHPQCVVPEQNHPAYFYTQRVWTGEEPPLPMDYPLMNFKGVRGGLMGRDLSGIYIGPDYRTIKNRRTIVHPGSPLAGPIEFPFGPKRTTKVSQSRRKTLNEYTVAHRKWWLSEGQYDGKCIAELRLIEGEIDRYGGVTLLHWVKPIDPKEGETGLLCPSTVIIESLAKMMAEDF